MLWLCIFIWMALNQTRKARTGNLFSLSVKLINELDIEKYILTAFLTEIHGYAYMV